MEETTAIQLRLTTDHAASSYGIGVLISDDDRILDGAAFAKLVQTRKAIIVVRGAEVKKRVEQALCAETMGTADRIIESCPTLPLDGISQELTYLHIDEDDDEADGEE